MKDQEYINASQDHLLKETDLLLGYEDAFRFLLEYRKLMMLFESAIQCFCVRLDMLEKESRLRGNALSSAPIRTA